MIADMIRRFATIVMLCLTCIVGVICTTIPPTQQPEFPPHLQMRWVNTKSGQDAFNILPGNLMHWEFFESKSYYRIEYKIIRKLTGEGYARDDYIIATKEYWMMDNQGKISATPTIYYRLNRFTFDNEALSPENTYLSNSDLPALISAKEWNNFDPEHEWLKVKDFMKADAWESRNNGISRYWNSPFWQDLFAQIFPPESVKK